MYALAARRFRLSRLGSARLPHGAGSRQRPAAHAVAPVLLGCVQCLIGALDQFALAFQARFVLRDARAQRHGDRRALFAEKACTVHGLANALSGRLRAAVLIGEDADQLADALADLAPILVVEKIDEAVRQAAGFSESGDTVLLAPACASLDQFPNYAARGDAFATAVLELSA